jgi:hypothetical protein
MCTVTVTIPPELERAFFAYLLTLTRSQLSSCGLAEAFYGFVLREHVDECHPNDVEEAFRRHSATYTDDGRREGFRLGYRFKEGYRGQS